MFLKLLETIVGKKSIRPDTSVMTTGKAWFSEIRSLAAKSRQSTSTPVELVKGKKIDVFTSDDIDINNTGKLYPDYKERREARKKEASVDVGNWDIYLD